MATVSWVIFKHHKKSDGTYNPKIRISHNGTSSYIPSPIFTDLVKFKKNSSTGSVTSGKIEDNLNSLVKKYREILNNSPEIVNESPDAKSLVAFIERREKRGQVIDFVEYGREYIETIKNPGTKEVRQTGLNVFCYFLQLTNNSDSLNIKMLTSKLLRKYETWLRSEHPLKIKNKVYIRPGLNDTGIRVYMSDLKTIFNSALLEYNDYELGDIVITNDPFKAYQMPSTLVSPKLAVKAENIKKIAEYTPQGKGVGLLIFARDIYMLSFYLAGMNIADMFVLEKIGDRLEYNRVKTKGRRKDNAFTSIGIIDRANDIITKYKDPTGQRVFDFYRKYSCKKHMTRQVNASLRKICKNLDIPELKFYSARHSFATIARNNCGISKDDISFCLNHSFDQDVTDTYIKQDFSRIENVIKKVVDYVFDSDL